MSRQFEIAFVESDLTVVAELLEENAPITCENFWKSIETPVKEKLHHAYGIGAEMWCYVPPPKEGLPYENSIVLPRPARASQACHRFVA